MNTIAFDFPPFVGAQIRNRTAQGMLKLKKRRRHHTAHTIKKYAFMATTHTSKNMPLWQRRQYTSSSITFYRECNDSNLKNLGTR
jgi:hypothetical protein